MEGVSFGLLDGLRASRRTQVQRLSLVGGGARSPVWAQQPASAIEHRNGHHKIKGARPALPWAPRGWPGWPAAATSRGCAAPPVASRFPPLRDERERLLERHARFAALYPALRATFHHAPPG